jgi:hypothetical protein
MLSRFKNPVGKMKSQKYGHKKEIKSRKKLERKK